MLVLQIESQLLRKMRGGREKSELQLSGQLKRVLELAADESRRTQRLFNHASYIGTEHLLLGLLSEKDCTAAKMLQALGLDLEKGRDAVIEYLLAQHKEDETKAV